MPRPLWKGAISFGMVSIPVKLYSATEEKDVRFNQLHKADMSRIRQKIVGDGLFYLVQTRLPAGLFLRTTLINPFTSTEDLQELMSTIRQAAA